MSIRDEIREIEKHVRDMTSDKNEQIAIISKAQSMTLENEHNLMVLAIAKRRVIRATHFVRFIRKDNTITKTIEIDGMRYELTEEKIRRINEAIAETQRQIDREMKYSEKFRKHEDIARWQAHIEKLEALKG